MTPLHTEILINVDSLIWKIPSDPCAKHTSKGSNWLNWKKKISALSCQNSFLRLAPFTSCSLPNALKKPSKNPPQSEDDFGAFSWPTVLIDNSPAYVVLRIPISSKGHSGILSIWPLSMMYLRKNLRVFDPIAHSYWRHWTQTLPWYF